MNLPEIKNPFVKARVVGSNQSYQESGIKRGDPAFVMSRSALCEFGHCPNRWKNGYSEDDTDATSFGSLIDCLILQPGEFDKRYAVAPSTYPAPAHHADVKKGKIKEGDPLKWNANAGWCEAWLEDAKACGKEVVKHEKLGMAIDAKTRLLSDPLIDEYIGVSQKQVLVTAEYHDRDTGIVVPVKCLIDMVPAKDHPEFGRSLGDLKTSTSASPSQWTRFVFQRGYHIQGALYGDIYTAATNEERLDFRHIVQENYSPWETSMGILSQEFIELGRATYIGHLRRYAKCLSENHWPGYGDGEMSLNGWTLICPEAWMIGK